MFMWSICFNSFILLAGAFVIIAIDILGIRWAIKWTRWTRSQGKETPLNEDPRFAMAAALFFITAIGLPLCLSSAMVIRNITPATFNVDMPSLMKLPVVYEPANPYEGYYEGPSYRVRNWRLVKVIFLNPYDHRVAKCEPVIDQIGGYLITLQGIKKMPSGIENVTVIWNSDYWLRGKYPLQQEITYLVTPFDLRKSPRLEKWASI